VVAYDPAFAYEIAVIVEAGIRRMYVDGRDAIYYLTLANEFYPMPAMPAGSAEGILKGMYRLTPAGDGAASRPRVRLLGSGALVNEVERARELLETEYGVGAEVWSITSYGELFRDALEADRWNRLHPANAPRLPYVRQCLGDGGDPVVAVSDYTRALPYSISRWVPGDLVALGTDGFGRSDSRVALRGHFEVDSRHVVVAASAPSRGPVGSRWSRWSRGCAVSESIRRRSIPCTRDTQGGRRSGPGGGTTVRGMRGARGWPRPVDRRSPQ